MEIVYGVQVHSMDDDYLRLAIESMDAFASSRMAGKYWVDYIPFLKYIPSWVPGASAVKYGSRWRPVVEEMVNRPFEAIQRQLKDSVNISQSDSSETRAERYDRQAPTPSMAAELITEVESEKDPARRAEEELCAKQATGISYAGMAT